MTKKNKNILISFEGNVTRATLIDGDTVSTATAKWNPADLYSSYEGARIALARLFGVEPFEVDDEPQFNPGDIVRLTVSDFKRGMVKESLGKVFWKSPNKMTPYVVRVLDEPRSMDTLCKKYGFAPDSKDVVAFAAEMRKIEEGKK